MRALRQSRRLWSKDEKLAILSETLDTSVSAVAKKYGIRSSLLFGWRKQFQMNGQNQQKTVANKAAGNTDIPDLSREYKKLAKIQAALSAKLKRDLANDAITAYNAGNTLISLYNGMSKLESLRTGMAGALNLEKTGLPESDQKSPEIRKIAERLLSMLVVGEKDERDRLSERAS